MSDEKNVRKVFWLVHEDNIGATYDKVLADPGAAAHQIYSLRVESATQKNAISWISERLQDAVQERDQLERALTAMSAARLGADNAVHALSEQLAKMKMPKRLRRKP